MQTIHKSLTAIAFLIIMLVLAYQQTQAPGIRASSDLDYQAINRHIEFIARKPHPMGGNANRQVRDYIVNYLESLGLSTQVQKTTVVYRHPTRSNQNTTIGNVENIVARLPGTAKPGDRKNNTLVLLTHYDSRPLTPGAADDASGTATVLEVARLMVSDSPPAHDVLFVITDGEEMGLLGAQGFFRQHPAAAEVGLVLNLEARGSSGVSTMFETSENNDWLIANLIESAPDLVADSLSYEIYRRMPNDTDMSISKGEDIAGLNFGFVGGYFDYHAMTDTPANLDQQSMAQQANYLLFTARHFAQLEDWQQGTENVTYFTVWPGHLVSYSEGTATVIGWLVLVFGLWVLITRVKSGSLRPATTGSGLLAILALISIVSSFFESMIHHQIASTDGIARLISLAEWPLLAYFIVVLGICAWFATEMKQGLKPGMTVAVPLALAGLSFFAGRPWQDAMILLVILLPLLMILSKRKNPPDVWSAGLITWWLLAAALVYLAPNASYMVIWPYFAVLLVAGMGKNTDNGDAVVPIGRTLIASFIPLLFLPTLIIMAYLALGSTSPQIIMMIAVGCMLLTWPLIQNIARLADGKIGAALFTLGVLATAFVIFGRGFDTRHPREQGLFLAVDVEQGQSFWVSPDAKPDTWAGAFMGDDAEPFNMDEILPGYRQTVKRRHQPGMTAEAASLEVTNEVVKDGQKEVTLHLRSPSNAEYINLLFPLGANITEATANGFPVRVPNMGENAKKGTDEPDADKNRDRAGGKDWWRWRWYGLPGSGAEIQLRFDDDQPLEVKVIEVDYGMPAGPPPRPADTMARKYTWSDSTVIFQTVSITP